MAKRLTEKQIDEIIKSFSKGETINSLSKKFKCTSPTIIRNLKKNLGELKYSKLINKNKLSGGKLNKIKTDDIDGLNTEINIVNESNISKTKQSRDILINDETYLNSTFFEIPPLNLEIENVPRKELSSIPISDVDFPKIVYMVVDKKIELEVKYLKDYPEWQFLPTSDLDRKLYKYFLI